jgi:putative peptidoglycan lipid II flippase
MSTPAVKDTSGPSLARSAGLVSALTLVSRLLGLVREIVFAAFLGAGLYADAFRVAFRIPNLLRDLFAEGALSAAFVPTYARVLKEEGEAGAHRLVSRLMTVLLVVIGALVLAGLVWADALVVLIAPGFAAVPGKASVTVRLTRIMLPFLPLVSLAAVAMGVLNARHRFGAPAFAPSTFNLVAILWAAGLWAAGLGPAAVAVGWAVGTLAGGAAQFLVQLPGLRSDGWRFRPDWAPRDPGLRRVFVLMAPATIGLAAVQINIFVSTIFASRDPGAVAWLDYAFRILYLPIGIFGVAVGTTAGAGFARRAAEADLEGLRATLRQALRLVGFLTVPALVGLVVLAEPVVRLLYERGRFGPDDTTATARALAAYTLGLVAYSAVKVLVPAFYALGQARVPLAGSALAVVTNLVMIAFLYGRLGYLAIAFGTALGALLNAGLLVALLQRQIGGIVGHGLGHAGLRIATAALVMAPCAWSSARALEGWVGTRGLVAQVVTGLGPVLVGVAAYLAVAQMLRIPELHELVGPLRRRFGRG